MNTPRKVLVLGATGAMGRYLVPLLADLGYQVDAVSLDEVKSDRPNVNCIKADAKDREVLKRLLANGCDGIVDFMIYSTAELPGALAFLPAHTDHYVYLSTYRIYDDKEHPVKESSPRLLDTAIRTTIPSTRRAAKTSCACCRTGTGPSSAPPSPIPICATSS